MINLKQMGDEYWVWWGKGEPKPEKIFLDLQSALEYILTLKRG